MQLQVESRPIADLKPFPRNARTHSAKQIKQIAASIREFGFVNPVLIGPDGGIIAGHGRVLAARDELGMAEVPCIVLGHLSEAQRRALVLADNRIALSGGWDESILALELGELKGLDFDLGLTGFDLSEIGRLLASNLDDEAANAVPTVPVEPVSRLGDLWLLGSHRVLCGDSTSKDATRRATGAALGLPVPFLMVTDPPYGVDYDPEWRVKAAEEGHLAYAASRIGLVANDDRTDWSAAWVLFPGDVIYCWSPLGSNSIESGKALLNSGFDIRNMIIWSKPHFPIGRGNYHYRHEPCWYAVRKGKSAHWMGDHKQTTVWEVSLDKNVEGGHSTQKPVELMRRPILNHTTKGDAVYEPFCGSGTTLIACEQTGRICYGIEIEPAYVDVIVQRWQNFTGKQATLDGDGRTFAEIAAERKLVTA